MRSSRTALGALVALSIAVSGCGSVLRDMMGGADAPTTVHVHCDGSGRRLAREEAAPEPQ